MVKFPAALFIYKNGAILTDAECPTTEEYMVSDPIGDALSEVTLLARRFVRKSTAYPYIIFVEV
jgi:hypothetical protein